jgi:hypothetical protein
VWLAFILWAYCWLRRETAGRQEAYWTVAAYATLGAGAAYKLVPALGLPLLAIVEWHGPDRRRTTARGLAGLAVGLGLPFLVQARTSGWAVFSFLAVHANRPIQIESLWASVLTVSWLWGAPIAISEGPTGYNMSGRLAPVLLVVSTVTLVVYQGAWMIWALRRHRFTRGDAYQAACLAIAGTVMLSKVLSPQFFIWTLPLLLLVAAERSREDPRWAVGVGLAVVAVAALTTWIYPYHFFYWGPDSVTALVPRHPDAALPTSPGAFIVLGIRNAGMVALVATLIARLPPTRPARPGGSAEWAGHQ